MLAWTSCTLKWQRFLSLKYKGFVKNKKNNICTMVDINDLLFLILASSHGSLIVDTYSLLDFLHVSPNHHRFNHTLFHLQTNNMFKSSLQTRLIYEKHPLSVYDVSNCNCIFSETSMLPTSEITHTFIDIFMDDYSNLSMNENYKDYTNMADKCLCDTLDAEDGPQMFVEETFCSTHGIFLNHVTFTEHGVEWVVSFEEEDHHEVISCGNPAFFIKGNKSSDCFNLSDSLEVVFDDSHDFTSTDLGMDMGIEIEFNFEGSISEESSICHDGSDYDSDSDIYETSEDETDVLCKKEACFGEFSFQMSEYEDEDDDCFEIDFVVDEECPWLAHQGEDINDEIVTDSGYSDSSNNESEMTPKSKYHSHCCSPKPDPEQMKPNGRVTFASPEKLVTVHRIWAWDHAYRKSRDNYWERYARDRAHFEWRTQRLADVLEPMLKKKLQDMEERTRQELTASS